MERRILDANLNRAREATRVLEDVARFALGRPDLTARAKTLRHTLARVSEGLDPVALAAWRDTPGDVGTTLTTQSETERRDVHAVVRANGARLGEALRVLEESAKVLGRTGAAEVFKQLRYEAYTLERDVVLALGSPQRTQWRLCVLITESLCRRAWLEVARAAFDAGAEAVQLREKTLSDAELLRRAKELVVLGHARGRCVIINDRPDIAVLAGADGVHVGRQDLPITEARRVVGGLLVGASCETLEQARVAAEQGADYIGLGAMFPTGTKEKDRIVGPALLRDLLAEERLARVPHLAIGGITPENVHELVEEGCRGVAVSSCVCGAEDPGRVCADLLSAMSP